MNKYCKSFEHQAWHPMALGRSSASESVGEQGFDWGYVDLIDAEGSGVVVIWSWGLPFMPGTVGRGRSGNPVNPHEEPSLCVAAYESGRQTAYVLQRVPVDQVEGERFGGLTLDSGAQHCHIQIDVPIPGGTRLEGEVRVEGTAVTLSQMGKSAHQWAPRIIGSGTAYLRCDGWSVKISGRAYHDGNSSDVGLESLGIRQWIWGRTPHEDGESVHYLLDPEDPALPSQNHVLEIDWSGAVEHRFAEVELDGEHRGLWGVRCPRSLDLGDRQVRHLTPYEDGPFYQRWRTEVTRAGRVHTGVGEVVDVTRMDRPLFAPLVGMAVHDLTGRSSIWVPLFCGPHQGRWARLFRHWRGH